MTTLYCSNEIIITITVTNYNNYVNDYEKCIISSYDSFLYTENILIKTKRLLMDLIFDSGSKPSIYLWPHFNWSQTTVPIG